MPAEDLLQTVCEEMPEFPERESALLSRLAKKQTGSVDKPTWQIGVGDLTSKPTSSQEPKHDPRKEHAHRAAEIASRAAAAAKSQPAGGAPNVPQSSSHPMQDLMGVSGPSVIGANAPATSAAFDQLFGSTAVQQAPAGPSPVALSMITQMDGVIYESQLLRITAKSMFQERGVGRISVLFENMTDQSVSQFRVTPSNIPEVALSCLQAVPNMVPARSHIFQVWEARCFRDFRTPPVLYVEGATASGPPDTDPFGMAVGPVSGGAVTTLRLQVQLPIYLTKYCAPVKMEADNFFCPLAADWRSSKRSASRASTCTDVGYHDFLGYGIHTQRSQPRNCAWYRP